MTIEQREGQGEEFPEPVIIIFPRSEVERETKEVHVIFDEIEDPKERSMMHVFSDHAAKLARIPEVRGVLLGVDNDGSHISLTTVVDQLVPNSEETSRIMNGVSEANKTVADAMKGIVSVGGRWTFCNGDFDGCLGKILDRERGKSGNKSPQSENLLSTLLGDPTEKTTVAVLKFKDS